jgi:hypothetical protein
LPAWSNCDIKVLNRTNRRDPQQRGQDSYYSLVSTKSILEYGVGEMGWFTLCKGGSASLLQMSACGEHALAPHADIDHSVLHPDVPCSPVTCCSTVTAKSSWQTLGWHAVCPSSMLPTGITLSLRTTLPHDGEQHNRSTGMCLTSFYWEVLPGRPMSLQRMKPLRTPSTQGQHAQSCHAPMRHEITQLCAQTAPAAWVLLTYTK